MIKENINNKDNYNYKTYGINSNQSSNWSNSKNKAIKEYSSKTLKEENRSSIFRIISLVIVSLIFLSIFIILSSFVITYINNMTGKVVYLVEFSILLSSFLTGLLCKSIKEAFFSGVSFSLVFFIILSVIAGEVNLSFSVIYLFLIIIISNVLGILTKIYFR